MMVAPTPVPSRLISFDVPPAMISGLEPARVVLPLFGSTGFMISSEPIVMGSPRSMERSRPAPSGPGSIAAAPDEFGKLSGVQLVATFQKWLPVA